MSKYTELQYYGCARNNGWQPFDEDTAEEFCRAELDDVDEAMADLDTDDWVDEFNWWKAKP